MFVNDSRCLCGNLSVEGTPADPDALSSSRAHFRVGEPVLQIHAAAIAVARPPRILIRSPSHHRVELTCGDCHARLAVYASRRGAFCQISRGADPRHMGSLPSEAFIAPLYLAAVPASIRRLFRPGAIEGEPERARIDDAADFDFMFSRMDEAVVGSFSGLGLFARDRAYLNLGEAQPAPQFGFRRPCAEAAEVPGGGDGGPETDGTAPLP
jgi:hypothetical protein